MRGKLVFSIFLISIFSLNALPHRMGCKYVDARTIPWMEEASIDITRQIPDSVDYSHGMPPVGWQYLGSCVAWATGYYYKGYQEYVDHGGWDMTSNNHRFHPKFMYNQINGGTSGAYPTDGMKCLCDLGVAPMSSCSYSNHDSISWPTEKGYNDAIAFRCEQSFYISVSNNAGIQALKTHMADDNDCAVISIYVWDPFYYGPLGDHIYDTGDRTGTMWGGHCICLVGYNDSLDTPDGKGAFRFVNSWGVSWEDNGYAWITYEAVKNSGMCTRQAYYATDRKNYQPTHKVAYQLSHSQRFDINIRLSIGPYGSPYWQSPLIFNWYQPTKAPIPYPDHPIILDITDGAEYLSCSPLDTIFIRVRDTDIDGHSGIVEDFSALSSQWGFHCPSPDTPKAMLDYGYTPLKVHLPNNEYAWQSFHRLPDNSGFIDLVGDMDSAIVLWTFPTNDSIQSSPIIADIDGDNTLDVVIGSNDDTLYAVDANGTLLWKYGMGGNVVGAPATADLDEDGKLEVVASSSNKKVVSLNGEDGSFNWSTGFINGVIGSPAINSIDSDRRLEVVGVGLFMRLINGEDGSAGIWLHMNGAPSSSSPAVGDVFEADGILDIVVGNQAGSVKFFNGRNGDVVGDFLTNDTVLSSPAIGDLDGDSLNEVVVGSNSDTLYALELDSLLWTFGTGGDVRSSPALGDIDGDGKLEVVFGSNDGNLYALNAEDGSLHWSYPTGGEVISSPAIADIDSNGVLDVIVGSTNGYLYAISGGGSLLWHLNLGTPITSSPALGDIDKDGYLEVAVGGLDGNLYLVNGIPSGVTEETPVEKLYLSRMNGPLHGRTIIHYSIPKRAKVNLSIFDVTGRNIRTLVNEIKNPGVYQIALDSKGISSGIYFYRLRAGDKSLSNKMVVVK